MKARLGMPRAACVAVVLGGCGPSASDVPFAEVCGEQGPVRILALDDDEAIVSRPSVVAFEDRWLYVVERFDRPVMNVNAASWSGEDRVIPQVGARVESIDPCGDDRRVVAEGIDLLLPRTDESEPWLGLRRDTRALFAFDPSGVFDPVPLARVHPGSLPHTIGSAVFVFREDQNDLVRFTIDGPRVETTALTTEVRVASFLFGERGPLAAVLILHEEGDFTVLDLSTGEETVLEPGVRMFTHDRAGRWVAWAHGDPATPWSELPTEATLLDRGTGERLALDAGGLPIAVRILEGVVQVNAVEDLEPVRSTTFTALPEGASLTLDGFWQLFNAGEGRFAAYDASSATATFPSGFVFGLQDGELRELAGPIQIQSGSRAGVWYPDPTPYEDDPAADGSGVPYDLVHLSFVDLSTRVEVPRVFSDVELPGDRWASVRDVDSEDFVGDLVVVDGSDGSASVIADNVTPQLLLEPHERLALLPWTTDDLVYQVREAGSGRTGLWRARFQ